MYSTADLIGFFKSFCESYTPCKSYWCYEDGCVLAGASALFEAGAGGFFRDFTVEFISERISSGGDILTYRTDIAALDDVCSSRQLFFAYTVTNDKKYLKAADFQMQCLKTHPRLKCGSFAHKSIYPSQLWLDGLYMAMPFYAMYDSMLNESRCCVDIARQFSNAKQRLCVDGGLYRHAWDESGLSGWADENGRSRCVWLRAMGWLLMACVDTLEVLPKSCFEHYMNIRTIFLRAVRALMECKRENGLLLLLPQLYGLSENYAETSGNAMICYAVLKASRLGIINPEKYLGFAWGLYDALIEQKLVGGKRPMLTDSCSCAGLGGAENRSGTPDYYISVPRADNDRRAVAALMLCCAERLRGNKGET